MNIMSSSEHVRNIAVFASGNGSNFGRFLDEEANGNFPGRIVLFVTDKPGCYAQKRAEEHGIPVFSFSPKDYGSKEEFEQEILRELAQAGGYWLVLAGYMRLVGPVLLQAYRGRIVNIHPSLLPAFPGKDAVGQALSYGVKWTGVTVHQVDEGMDTGPIIAQEVVAIAMGDSREALQVRIQAVEHALYPKTVAKLIQWTLNNMTSNFEVNSVDNKTRIAERIE